MQQKQKPAVYTSVVSMPAPFSLHSSNWDTKPQIETPLKNRQQNRTRYTMLQYAP